MACSSHCSIQCRRRGGHRSQTDRPVDIRELGQPVVVENRAGATGAIGSLAVARSAPDGYTILMAVISSHAVAPAMKKEPPFDPSKISLRLFASRTACTRWFLERLSRFQMCANWSPTLRPTPAKLPMAVRGSHVSILGGKLMERRAGIEMIHVPFSGDGPAMTAVVSQNLDILFTPSGRSYVEAQVGEPSRGGLARSSAFDSRLAD